LKNVVSGSSETQLHQNFWSNGAVSLKHTFPLANTGRMMAAAKVQMAPAYLFERP
jgi:hypothetical protein